MADHRIRDSRVIDFVGAANTVTADVTRANVVQNAEPSAETDPDEALPLFPPIATSQRPNVVRRGHLYGGSLSIHDLAPGVEAVFADAAIVATPARSVFPMSEESVEPMREVVGVLHRLVREKSSRVVVFGHSQPPPDGDCVGAALGLSRALRALGLEVDVCIDQGLPSGLRKLDPEHEIRPASALAGRAYDVAIIVDTADTWRISAPGRQNDAEKVVRAASTVLVIDHHQGDATKSLLGLSGDVEFAAWDEKADSASLMVAAAIEHLFDESGGNHDEVLRHQAKYIFSPLAFGTITDTNYFMRDGILDASKRVFKHIVGEYLGGEWRSVVADGIYEIPLGAAAILSPEPTIAGRVSDDDPRCREIRKGLERLIRMNIHVVEEYSEDGAWAYIGCPRPIAELALEAARLDDPLCSMADIMGHYFLRRADALVYSPVPGERAQFEVVAVWFDAQGARNLCARSQIANPAMDLVKHVMDVALGEHDRDRGGRGGKVAAAQPREASFGEVHGATLAWLRRRPWVLAEEAGLRRGGNL